MRLASLVETTRLRGSWTAGSAARVWCLSVEMGGRHVLRVSRAPGAARSKRASTRPLGEVTIAVRHGGVRRPYAGPPERGCDHRVILAVNLSQHFRTELHDDRCSQWSRSGGVVVRRSSSRCDGRCTRGRRPAPERVMPSLPTNLHVVRCWETLSQAKVRVACARLRLAQHPGCRHHHASCSAGDL